MSGPAEHRREFAAALAALPVELAEAARVAADAIGEATAAVLTNPAHARVVHRHVAHARRASQELDDRIVTLMALQSPVAGDLRLAVVGLRISAALERMTELAGHVAESGERRDGHVVPPQWQMQISELGMLCAGLATGLKDALLEGDSTAARNLEHADEQIDGVHRRLMAAVTAPSWEYGTQAGIDVALLSRFYERFADQAVTAARQLSTVH
ncbi:MAG: phosphate signaling complex PhoU family protein [Frankia sp.]